jgi:hypothetical protein
MAVGLSRSHRAGLLALAAGTVAAALLHAQGAAPPVFDGIIVPPEPYRWVSPPPSLASGNKAPLPGEVTLPVRDGQVFGGSVQTGDNQVIMSFGVGLVKVSSSAQSIKCTVVPVATPPPPPSGAEIRGNVVRIGCVEQASGAALTAVGTFRLTLRFPPGGVKEVQFYDGTAWHALATTRAPGGAPFVGVVPNAFGDFAVTAPPGATGESIFANLGRYLEFFGIIAFVLIFGVIAGVHEWRRRRKGRP